MKKPAHSFMKTDLTLAQMILWYYAQKTAEYQNRPLDRAEVCAVIAFDLDKRPASRCVHQYALFRVFDDPADKVTIECQTRAMAKEGELYTKVNSALEKYFSTDNVARNRATAFAGM